MIEQQRWQKSRNFGLFHKCKILCVFSLFFVNLGGGMAFADWDATLNLGIHSKDALRVSSHTKPSLDITKSVTGILGADVLYRLLFIERPLYNGEIGIGLRYQLYLSSGRFNSNELSDLGVTTGPFTSTGSRLALLLNYRTLFKKQLFVGAIYAIDIWRSIGLKQTGRDIFKASQLIGFISQIGLEVGVKVTPYFLIRAEFGLNNFSFGDVNCLLCEGTDTPNLSLTKPYVSLGMEWLFSITALERQNSPPVYQPSSSEQDYL